MAGTLTAHLLDEKLDENGTSFKDAATAVGYGGKSHQVSCMLACLSSLHFWQAACCHVQMLWRRCLLAALCCHDAYLKRRQQYQMLPTVPNYKPERTTQHSNRRMQQEPYSWSAAASLIGMHRTGMIHAEKCMVHTLQDMQLWAHEQATAHSV